ncbi:MAG: TIGR00266 family protein [Thermoflexia bacterium]|nr:MAG: TIGR00266 family protein [Thermoflexia bacterium]
MEIEVLYRPSYSLGVIRLGPNEAVRVESGAMVSMSAGITVETKAAGGVFKALARSVLAKESFFQNTYRAPASGGELTVAPALPGDLFVVDLKNETLMAQSGSYVASEMGVNLDTKWGGAKTFFASEGLILLRASGTGKLLLSSFGAIHEVNLKPGETYTVDTGHLVAFTEGIGFKVRRVGGLRSTLFSGEGLVVDLTGPGRVFLQTRSVDSFLAWLIPHFPRSSGGGSE